MISKKDFYNLDYNSLIKQTQGEIKMAEIDTTMLSGELSEIRKEAVDHTNEIVREGLKNSYSALDAVSGGIASTKETINKTTTDVYKKLDREGDRVSGQLSAVSGQMSDRFYALGSDTADLRAQVVQTISEVRNASAAAAKDNEIAVLKNQIEGQKNTQSILEKVGSEGYETRRLINELKHDDLNRMLIERNAEVVEERSNHGHWKGHYDQAQFAALQSQLQAFGSQLQETRMGMVNFGSMSGVGQTSTNNIA